MNKRVNIFVDVELWKRTKAQSALDGKPIAQWVIEAIELKLKEKK